MQVSLIFNNSGDEIKFVATNHDVVDYYIDQLNLYNVNNFSVTRPSQLNSFIEQLRNDIDKSNEFLHILTDYKQGIIDYTDIDLIDQAVLNQLHCYPLA